MVYLPTLLTLPPAALPSAHTGGCPPPVHRGLIRGRQRQLESDPGRGCRWRRWFGEGPLDLGAEHGGGCLRFGQSWSGSLYSRNDKHSALTICIKRRGEVS